MPHVPYVDHEALARHANSAVNVPSAEAAKRREQVRYLRERLEAHIAAHPDYDLVKLRGSGSTAKHTAIRRRRGEGSDADVAAYVRAGQVGGLDVNEADLLNWLLERCKEVYGRTKVAEDFQVSDHAVGITMHGTKLKIDVVPVLYVGDADDKGYLVTRDGTRVLTSVTQHLQFIRSRRQTAGAEYLELIRLLKAFIREAKRNDEQLRCKSFLIELIVAHLWDHGWLGAPLAVNDYPRAFEQVLGYIVNTELRSPIIFTDFYDRSAIGPSNDAMQVWDPVNPDNNIVSSYTEYHRARLVDVAKSAFEEINWAALAPTKGDAVAAWCNLLGPSFGVA
ncbi:CBASS oligonucleotide cyclase [Micromonospora sp. DR5-3]|uniref:CBASS oligonucleotide cyclase n=1 Tax=unclassified Micromonospora TaxID=2617518 RepID=UPI001CA332D3|nr:MULTISPECIES: CBASS oligonucleotide cyclase [unclassified Micromonospora]MCW3814456.1 CBASS oligonucleotide cyclase [Micromonospora sp. DR5-3]